jgi:CO/xanthine dehydrogenase FAD-binding subunit
MKLLAQEKLEPEADFAYESPRMLGQLLALRTRYPQAQLVAGCTDVGLWVTKMHMQFERIIDVTQVRELRRVEHYPHHLAIGAAVTLTDAFAALVAEWPQLASFAHRFAGLPVRNSGTLGGNVANGSPIGDSMPLLIALGAHIVLMSTRGHREMPLEDLYTGYRKNVMAADEVLAWIKVPKATAAESSAAQGRPKQARAPSGGSAAHLVANVGASFLRAYKISKRFEDDISAVCLALNLHIEAGVVRKASIGVGGVAATPVRARKTEAALLNQPWNVTTAQNAAAAGVCGTSAAHESAVAQVAGAAHYSGFGGPQGVIVIETIMGDIARHLQLDPLDVRVRNLYNDAEGRNTTHYGMQVQDNILQPLLSTLELSAQYRQRREAIAAWNKTSSVLQRGIAITPVKFGISFTATLFNQAGALVHVYLDGSVQVNHGGTEMGQGLHTKVAQVVADELGVPVERVLATASDTSKVPNASATAASAGTDLNGRAAQYAAAHVRDNLAAFVGGLDGCGAGAVQFAHGLVHTPTITRSFVDVVKLAYANRIQLWSDGFYRTPKIHYDKATLTGRPFFYFAYGAACTEVAIDTLTGESKVLRVNILHDVGRSINPAIDVGQIEGGFVQGMGWLTTEQLVWNNKGMLTTHAPAPTRYPLQAMCQSTCMWRCGPSPTGRTRCSEARRWVSHRLCWLSACMKRYAMRWRRRGQMREETLVHWYNLRHRLLRKMF